MLDFDSRNFPTGFFISFKFDMLINICNFLDLKILRIAENTIALSFS